MLFNIALLLQEKGKYADAVHFYQDVLKQDPADAVVHYNFANLMLAQDNPCLWQACAWYFRQFMAYAKKDARYNQAGKSLNTLESNLAALYSGYQNKHYSHDPLVSILLTVHY